MLAPLRRAGGCCASALGLFPGVVLRVLGTRAGVAARAAAPGGPRMGRAGHVVSGRIVRPRRAGDVRRGAARRCRARGGARLAPSRAVRRVPTWGCGGELTADAEYTATAFSKPLMMIFRAVYRPTRQVEAQADVSPYFPQEVRYHAEIEPTFERYVYGPAAARRPARRRPACGAPGRKPPRLSRLRDRARRLAGAARAGGAT